MFGKQSMIDENNYVQMIPKICVLYQEHISFVTVSLKNTMR